MPSIIPNPYHCHMLHWRHRQTSLRGCSAGTHHLATLGDSTLTLSPTILLVFTFPSKNKSSIFTVNKCHQLKILPINPHRKIFLLIHPLYTTFHRKPRVEEIISYKGVLCFLTWFILINSSPHTISILLEEVKNLKRENNSEQGKGKF